MLKMGDGGNKLLAKLFDWGHSSDNGECWAEEIRRHGMELDQVASIVLMNWKDAVRPPEGGLGSPYAELPLWSLDMFMAGGVLVQLLNGNILPKVVQSAKRQ